jgi:RNA polymerase sigma-70 factor (ECF subfamily)
MNTTSASLLERLRQPVDREAWGRFVQIYTPLIYGFTCRLGVPDQDRADLVQQVFTLLIQKLPAFAYDQHKRFRGWLWTLTLNQWRAVQRQRTPALLGPADASLDQVPDPQSDCVLGDEEYREYLVGRVMKLLQAEFQPTTWKAFWECVACNRSGMEVAGQLGISVAAVYAAKSRVLRRLRQELQGLWD